MAEYFIDRIYERDVDLALVEECTISPNFARWCASAAKLETDDLTALEVYASLADEAGESDVTVIFKDANEKKIALLIENKVDAIFQPKQLERYRIRGQNGVAHRKWDAFSVLVIAPKSYIERSSYCSLADGCLSYEDIASYFRSQNADARNLYRAKFFDSAAPRGATAYVRYQDDKTNNFWAEAYKIACSDFPRLELKEPNVARGTIWISLKPKSFPKNLVLDIKGGAGVVDLTFYGVDIETLRGKIGEEVARYKYLWIVETGKSAAIRQFASKFQISENFEDFRPAIIEAFEKCYAAIDFFDEHRVQLSSLLDK